MRFQGFEILIEVNVYFTDCPTKINISSLPLEKTQCPQKIFLKETLGAFHSTKTSTLNFRQLPVANGRVFFKTSEKEDNLARHTQILEKFLTEDFFPFNFAPGISG